MNIILLFQFLGDWYMLKRKPTGAKKISVDKYAWHVTKGTGNTLNIRQTGRWTQILIIRHFFLIARFAKKVFNQSLIIPFLSQINTYYIILIKLKALCTEQNIFHLFSYIIISVRNMLNGIPFNFCYQTTQCSSIGHTIIILLPCTLIIRCYNQTYLLLIVHPKHVLRRHDLFSDWQLREFTDHASTRRQLSLRALIMVNFSGGRTQVNLYH